jgi:hypothetical protein
MGTRGRVGEVFLLHRRYRAILPYDRYVAAETFLSLSQVPGRFGTMFQSPEQARAAINELRRAQAEGEVRCFLTVGCISGMTAACSIRSPVRRTAGGG